VTAKQKLDIHGVPPFTAGQNLRVQSNVSAPLSAGGVGGPCGAAVAGDFSV